MGLPITGARKIPSQERPSQALSCWRRSRHPSFKQGQAHPRASISPTVLLITKLSHPLPPHGTGACWKSQRSARPLRPLREAPSRASPLTRLLPPHRPYCSLTKPLSSLTPALSHSAWHTGAQCNHHLLYW